MTKRKPVGKGSNRLLVHGGCDEANLFELLNFIGVHLSPEAISERIDGVTIVVDVNRVTEVVKKKRKGKR